MQQQGLRNMAITKALPRARIEQWIMFAVAGVLLASGVGHLLFWLVAGGSLSGDVSLRKPILFGFSAGVTMLSLGWVVGKLRKRRSDSVMLSLFSVAMLLEVSLITLQQWRGVSSHFNRSTTFDASILSWIEGLIVFATIVIAELTRRSFQRLSTSVEMVVAIRGGMVLLLFACLLGFVHDAYGNQRVTVGQDPVIFGNAGVMKFPHGIPLHAIQFLPLTAWIFRRLRAAKSQRLKAVQLALSSVTVFTLYSMVQTFTGRARFEFWWFSAVLLSAAVALFALRLTSFILQLTAETRPSSNSPPGD
jgi:hypothetical protein